MRKEIQELEIMLPDNLETPISRAYAGCDGSMDFDTTPTTRSILYIDSRHVHHKRVEISF